MPSKKITKKKIIDYTVSRSPCCNDKTRTKDYDSNSNSDSDSYFDSDESLSEDDEREVSIGIVGEIFYNKYICLKYLGKGTFSRVWLVYCLVTKQFLAMKMIYSKYSEDAENEIEMYKCLGQKYQYIARFYDSFYFNEQVCIVTELMGICLLDFVKNYLEIRDSEKKWYDSENTNDVLPIEVVKLIFKQLFRGLVELHNKQIVHTDIKPENVMVNIFPNKIKNIKDWFNNSGIENLYNESVLSLLPDNFNSHDPGKKKLLRKKCRIKALNLLAPEINSKIVEYHDNIYKEKLQQSETILDIDDINDFDNLETNEIDNGEVFDFNSVDNLVCKIIDLGNAELLEDFEPEPIQLRCYRAPENVVFDFYNTKADIWTMGCMLFENLTGEFLFEIDHELYKDSLDKDLELLAQMYSILGEMSIEDTYKSPYKDQLFVKNTVKLKDVSDDRIEPNSISDLLKESNNILSKGDIDLLSDLFKKILCYRHEERLCAEEVLAHPWFN